MRILCSLLAVSIVGMAAYFAFAQDQETPKPLSFESKLLELMKERRATLHQALEYQKAQFLQGTVSLEDMLKTEVALAHADLEIAPTLAARQIVHERLIKQLRQQEEVALAKFKLGKVTHMNVFDAKSARLQAEIDMLKDRSE
ncbi:hypothetical protein [Bremerella alba]|uniref:Periplasmic heavy metal sensor n=1 Tax=Bremerella alba TaxID=980252 RepID=A0A7V9A685_9BACT|nr:hypothetical protein [Bremerella alba]MBA2114052.1 hypothetical protein [Bremerella alba]